MRSVFLQLKRKIMYLKRDVTGWTNLHSQQSLALLLSNVKLLLRFVTFMSLFFFILCTDWWIKWESSEGWCCRRPFGQNPHNWKILFIASEHRDWWFWCKRNKPVRDASEFAIDFEGEKRSWKHVCAIDRDPTPLLYSQSVSEIFPIAQGQVESQIFFPS